MMWLKAYIVDDEYLERTLLRASIPWREYGVEITGEAGSSKELLDMLQKSQPDIIFTDICMPCMDGLTLARKIREDYQDIEIVILSGHRDFDYAKKAIGIGVSEYLLKPIDHEELKALIKKIRNRRCVKKEPPPAGTTTEQYNQFHENLPAGIVKQAIGFIAKSLNDSNLSLRTVAENLYVNPSYLSRVFRKETGETLTNYITRLRIIQSTEYLKHTDLKAYEIAKKNRF